MKTENLSTLKIHKLTQEQYERELANNNIDYTAMYLTPDEGRSQELATEITESVTDEQVPSAKAVYTYVQSASTDHEHSQYALADDVDSAISGVNENVENHLIDTSNPHSVTANQIGAVPDTRTVNGKVLSTDITLSYSDVDADQSGTAQTKANEALEGAKAYTDSSIISKANIDDLNNHTDDTDIHVTIDEKIAWNNKSDFSGDYNDLNNKPEIPSIEGLASETYVNEKVSQVDIPSALSELAEDETHRVVTDSEKAAWNAKSDFSGSYNDLTDKPSIPSIEGLATEDYVNEHKDNKENPHNVTTEQINAVPNTRTVNGKALNNDITLTPEDIGADVSGTAESKATNALNIAKEYTDTEVDKVESTLNTHTSDTNPHNINAELLGVYTKSEVDTKTTELSDKIQENTNAITTLNGVGDGSVDKKITDAFNEFAENLSDDNTVNTYKELIDYASSHNSEFTNLVGEVTSNKNNISDLTTTLDNHTTNTNNPHNVTVDQIGAVPNSRTINSKPLTSNITLTASDVGADASGSANTAESNAKSYTNTQISNLSTSVDTKLSGKADSSHGTHVTYSTTAPVMDGTASVGSATSVARSDHKHPTDTSRASQTDLTSHVGDTTKHITSTERTNWNAAKTHADSTHAPTNAEKNQNAFSNIKAGSTTISADTTTDTFEFVAGSNITLTPDATNDKLTISATNTTYNAASQSASGLMSAADKTKLDGIATGADKTTVDSALSSTSTNPVQNKIINSALANKVDKVDGKGLSEDNFTTAEKNKLAGIASGANAYTHPTTTGNKHIPSGGSSGQILRWSSDGTAVWGADNNTTYSAATTSAAGLMSAADKTKLNGIATGANAYTHPTTSGNKHIPSGGSSGQILRWSADGTAAWGADNNTTYSVATSSTDGLTPKADASAGTISSQANQWVLTRNGTTVDWYKLPANAFNNSTYSLSSFGITATANELNSLHPTADTTKAGYWLPTIIDIPENGKMSEVLGGYIELPTNLGLVKGNTYTIEVWEDSTAAYGEANEDTCIDSFTLPCVDAGDLIGTDYAGMLLLTEDGYDCFIYDKITINSNGEPVVGTGCAIIEAFTYFEEPYRILIKGTFSGTPNLNKPSKLKTINANINGVARSAQALTDCSYSGYEIADKLEYIETINNNLSSNISSLDTRLSTAVNKKTGEKLSGYQYVNGVSTSTGTNAERLNDYRTRNSTNAIGNVATGQFSLAIGCGTTSAGDGSFSAGWFSKALGNYAVSMGNNSTAGYGGVAIGSNLVGNDSQTVFGHYNKKFTTDGTFTNGENSLFIVGNGYYSSSKGSEVRTNAFRITNGGAVMGTQSFTASGADYAEYYEWADGNPNGEDRRGYFVTYEDGNKIRIATDKDDYILGVISSRPAIIGNGFTDEWQGLYLTDVYGERLTETVEVEERETKDEEGNVIETIPAHTEIRFILNPDYDPEQEYIGRDRRPEWAVVGTHGQLVLIDNGTCTVNSYCTVGDDGTAIPTEKSEYRVIARLDDTHIRIVIK